MMPPAVRPDSPPEARYSLVSRLSTSSPTYPASVKVVASPMTTGTFSTLASAWTRSVLPEPVGPISRTLDRSMGTCIRSGASSRGSGPVTLPVERSPSASRLKWLLTATASFRLAACWPTTWRSRWATSDLGLGTEPSRSAQVGGGVGWFWDGTGTFGATGHGDSEVGAHGDRAASCSDGLCFPGRCQLERSSGRHRCRGPDRRKSGEPAAVLASVFGCRKMHARTGTTTTRTKT